MQYEVHLDFDTCNTDLEIDFIVSSAKTSFRYKLTPRMAQLQYNNSSKLDQTNSTTWPTSIAVFLSVSNIFLSIAASLGNILILIVLPKVTSLHPPTKLLFRCLAVTDLCVGLVSHPLHATFIILKMKWKISYFIGFVNSALSVLLCGVSVVTSTAVSVDRLIALSLGLRYRQVVTVTRVRVFILCSWICCALLGSMHLWTDPEVVWDIAFIIILLCLLTSIFSYTRIHFRLRQHQVQVQAHLGRQNSGGVPLDIARYKKTVSSTFLVQLALIVCYAPFCIVTAMSTNEKGHYMAWIVTTTLVFLNSSMNPILYCWKIREVNRAVKVTVRQMCGALQ